MRTLLVILYLATFSPLFSQIPVAGYQLRLLHELNGPGYFGTAATTLGDVNGDGLPDFLIGSATGPQGGGGHTVHAYSGSDGSLLWFISGPSHFGGSVAGLTDLNGDGVDDFAVGAPQANGNRGLVQVHSGADQSILYTLFACGCSYDDRFGNTLAPLADIDGDGIQDFLVGAGSDDPGTGHYAGRVWAFSGATGSVIYTINGATSFDYFGTNLQVGPDLDGDGVVDFVAGAHQGWSGSPGPGYAQACSGATGAIIHTWTGAQSLDNFGGWGQVINDIDADGTADVVLTVSGADAYGTDRGLVQTYSGATGQLIYEIAPSTTVDADFGSGNEGGTVVQVQDVDSDNIDDFMIGTRSAGSALGVVQVFSGGTGALVAELSGQVSGGGFGATVKNLGDINGDGSEEIMIAATYIPKVYIYSLELPYTPPFPGSGADLLLELGVNGPLLPTAGIHSVTSGDTIDLQLWSPGGTYNYTPPLLIAQPFPTGSTPIGPILFPEVHIGTGALAPYPAVVLYDGSFLGLTPGLSPLGFSTTATVPPGMAPISIMLQGFCLAPNSNNPVFTSTDAHEIRIQ